jgi:hypothetical protein
VAQTTRCARAVIGLFFFSVPYAAFAIDIDVSAVGFTSFAPNPIRVGQVPTSFGFAFHITASGSINANFNYAIFLSPNTTFGDGDDISMGSIQRNTPFGTFRDTSGTNFSLTGLHVPPSTAAGQYNAYLTISPVSPNTDPDFNDAIAQLSGLITVNAAIVGDYNYNGVVDGADYVVWRNSGGPPADYNTWRNRFGLTSGAGTSLTTVPEPISSVLLSLTVVALCSRRHRSGAWLARQQTSVLKRTHCMYPCVPQAA